MIDRVLISAALSKNILAIKQTQRLIDRTTLRLASGLKVNSSLDNAQSFFEAKRLSNRASDLNKRLDGLGNSIQTINEAAHGVEAIEKLLRLGETITENHLAALRAGEFVEPTGIIIDPLSTQIIDATPVAYWRMNESAGATAANLGSIGVPVDGSYLNNPTLNAGALYSGGDTSVRLDGISQAISIPDNVQINTSNHANRTVELVFNADTTTPRQVLYEEGANVNAFSIYILNGLLYINGRDQGAWGPVNISMPISADETYHVAFTFDSVVGEFIGYLNGEPIGQEAVPSIFPAHSGDIGIGFMNGSTWFHDGSQIGNAYYFDGRISDVAIYNDTLTPEDMASHAAAVIDTGNTVPLSDENQQFNEILDQIRMITIDANYRGINLLASENLLTLFNETGSSNLLSEGVDFTAAGLGVKHVGFRTETGTEAILDTVKAAIKEVRDYGRTLSNDLNILQIRLQFTKEIINELQSGAQDLTHADLNEEGANLLASQARQQLAFNSLAFASAANARTIDLFA